MSVRESRRYFAEDFASSDEDDRLAVLAANYDPETFRLLEDCGVDAGWRCAEVGAGSGSVAAWLADVVGAEGSVAAYDIDISHLDDLVGRPNVEVHEHDIVVDPIPEAYFDLVHARLVVEHLPEPERLLAMLAAAVKPGGVLTVECTDMLATAAADPSDPRSGSFDEFMTMSFAAVASMSTFDVGFARRMPASFDTLGLDECRVRVVGSLARGGGSKAAEYAMPVAATLRSAFIERGHATAEAVDAYLTVLADPSFWFVANSVVAASGRASTRRTGTPRPDPAPELPRGALSG
jgi:SAM-dependent methyltransferase